MRSWLPMLVLLALSACSDDTAAGRDLGLPDKSADQTQASCATSAFLPADAAVGDFKQKGKPQAAATGQQLDNLINGGSEKYKQNKFLCMVQAVYESTAKSASMKVWIFDQTDATGAEGAYKASAHPDDTATATTIGDASRENLKYLTDYTADMRKGRYLARVVLDVKTASADGLAMLSAIVKAMP